MVDELAELLTGEPLGVYLLERIGDQIVLWWLSEGEPPDGTLEAAEAWTLAPAG
jgi:hypothetical protein